MADQKKDDLKPMSLEPSAGQQPMARATLEDALASALAKARQTSGWYWIGKRKKKLGGFWLRYPVLLLGALAAAWPLGREILGGFDIAWRPHPLGSTLLLILAGLLLAYDRFGDYTSGWVRYVRAGTRINALTEQFEIEMAADRVGLADTPTPEQAKQWMTKCAEFIRGVNTVVENETEQWATTFQETIRQLDENLAQMRQSSQVEARKQIDDTRKQLDEARPGAINITVANGDQFPAGWRARLDENIILEGVHGKSASVSAPPGLRRVTVEGLVGGQPVTSAQAVTVPAGGIVELKLGLPDAKPADPKQPADPVKP